ncbi:hypothetical protein GW17_00035397 [Ensete ventricosum]|nr:hypothetical protein GW17_00035397 [Ensete ventricosum]
MVAGAVAPYDPHPAVSLLRCLLASNRSRDLLSPDGSNHPHRSLPQPSLAPAVALIGHSRGLLLQPPSDLATIFRPALGSPQSAASASSVSSFLYRNRASATTPAVDGSSRSNHCFPCILLCCCSFCSSRPALDPSLHSCHRHTPPLCSIVTGSDLRPTVPSPPSNALLLLS